MCSTLFDNTIFEGICGWFGRRIDGGPTHIGSLGFIPDDVSVSFTVCRLFVVSMTRARQTEDGALALNG